MIHLTSAQILQLLIEYRYVILVPIAFAEGPIISIVCGFLIHIGVMTLLPAYVLLMLGDLIGDVFWYGIGYYYGHPFILRFGKFFGVSEENVKRVKEIFHRYHSKIIFVSKVTMGLGFALATLITAGITKINFRRYMFLNAFGQFIWTAILLVIGYEFGNLYTQIAGGLGILFFIGGILFLALAVFGFGRYVNSVLISKTDGPNDPIQ